MIRLIRRDRERGQSLVEFALAFPIFILLIFGLIDLGRAVFVSNSLAEMAREGARYGAVQARAWDDTRRNAVEDWILDNMPGVPNAVADVTCTASRPTFGCTVDDVLQVTVSTDLEMITPIIGQIVGTLSLEGSSEALIQN